jgi:uroporphyrinogen decarboxylase
MTSRENIIRAYTLKSPEYIPISAWISPAAWKTFERTEMEKLVLTHKILFPDYKEGSINPDTIELQPWSQTQTAFTDSWGCEWKTTADGIVGTVVTHPFPTWNGFESFTPPDIESSNGRWNTDWRALRSQIEALKNKGQFTSCNLVHGHSFLLITDMRGFENTVFDMHDEEPNLFKLIEVIEKFNLSLVKRFIDFGVDMIYFPEDLGTQNNMMITPEHFRKYVKPTYKKIMEPVKQNNILVHLHSDGLIMEIIEDLIECGIDVINLQDLVNGIESIAKNIKGKIAIDLDIDRQNITLNGTQKDIDDLIREEVIKLGSKKGGLSLIYGVYPGTPIKNIKAVMDAMEKYCFYYE